MSDREYKTVIVVLRIIDVQTDQVEKETIKNIDSRERREWISKTVLWAMMNGKYVEIINKNDDI
jgi:phage-related holin